MSIETHIQDLYSRGRELIEHTNQVGWELAEIVNDLYESGQTDEMIAGRLGWATRVTPGTYRKAHVIRELHPRFADAFVYASASDDRAIAISAVAEADGIAAGTAKIRPSVKAITAEISGLPADEKRAVAKELAMDKSFTDEVKKESMRQVEKDFDDRIKARKRDKGIVETVKTGLDAIVVLTTIARIASDLTTLDNDVKEHDFSDEERDMFTEYVSDIRLKLDTLMVSLDSADWDMKELAHEEG